MADRAKLVKSAKSSRANHLWIEEARLRKHFDSNLLYAIPPRPFIPVKIVIERRLIMFFFF